MSSIALPCQISTMPSRRRRELWGKQGDMGFLGRVSYQGKLKSVPFEMNQSFIRLSCLKCDKRPQRRLGQFSGLLA